jgi:hypothetical protein
MIQGILLGVVIGIAVGIGVFTFAYARDCSNLTDNPAAGALRFAMRATSVDAEHLYAALSVYLLAGIFFGIFYWVVEQIEPDSFTVASDFSRMSVFHFGSSCTRVGEIW